MAENASNRIVITVLGKNRPGIVAGISRITGLRDRGTFARPSLYVLRRTKMPSTLIEMGFITNPEDARLMSEDPSVFAIGIYNGILNYLGL